MKDKIIAKQGKWSLIPHSHQIADTGDYDGCYEITDGKVSIYTTDDNDEALEPIVKALNDSGCKFYLDDSAGFGLHVMNQRNKELEQEISSLKAEQEADEIFYVCEKIVDGRAVWWTGSVYMAEGDSPMWTQNIDNAFRSGDINEINGLIALYSLDGYSSEHMYMIAKPISSSLRLKAEAEKEISDEDIFKLLKINIKVISAVLSDNLQNDKIDMNKTNIAELIEAMITEQAHRDNLIKKG